MIYLVLSSVTHLHDWQWFTVKHAETRSFGCCLLTLCTLCGSTPLSAAAATPLSTAAATPLSATPSSS